MKHEEILYDHLPEVFQPRNPPEGWSDDWILVPIEKPDFNVEPLNEDTSVPVFPRDPWLEEDMSKEIYDAVESDDLVQITAVIEKIVESMIGATSKASGSQEYPGQLGAFPSSNSGFFPPPDCLAFYLPFHYFRPTWWGIYLVHEGVEWLTAKLRELDGGHLSPYYYRSAARLFLYNHESYHHRIESFASRLEISHRSAAYITGFEKFFQKTLVTDGCLEEALANAYAYRRVKLAFKSTPRERARVLDALERYIEKCPEGYRMAMQYVGDRKFKEGENKLAEESLCHSYPDLRKLDCSIWEVGSQLTRGFGQIKSRIQYVIPRNTPLSARVPNRFAKRPREVIKALRKMVGLTLARHGGNHDIYQTNDGNKVTIPRHPGDLGRGLFAKIIKEAGLDMSVSEFLKLV